MTKKIINSNVLTVLSVVSIFLTVLSKQNEVQNLENTSENEVIHFHKSDDQNSNDIQLFKSELKNNDLTVVKFSASWCSPCKQYEKILKKVAKELKKVTVNNKDITVKYISIDVDEVPGISARYKIKLLPTTLIFKNETLVDTTEGVIRKGNLIKKIKELAN